jgi:hypothetical protein
MLRHGLAQRLLFSCTHMVANHLERRDLSLEEDDGNDVSWTGLIPLGKARVVGSVLGHFLLPLRVLGLFRPASRQAEAGASKRHREAAMASPYRCGRSHPMGKVKGALENKSTEHFRFIGKFERTRLNLLVGTM